MPHKFGEDGIICLIVTDDEGAQSDEFHRRLPHVHPCFGSSSQPQRKPQDKLEAAPLPHLALHRQQAAHLANETRGYGQSQTGAAKTARGGAVGLNESLKDGLLFFGRDSDSGVDDGETHGCTRLFGVRTVRLLVAQDQRNRPFFGKLHRIANQIDQHLAQAPRISNKAVWNRCRRVQHEFQPFLRRGNSKKLGGFRQKFTQVKINGVNFEFTRLDLRKIENVVDDGEKGVAGSLHQGQVFALLGR